MRKKKKKKKKKQKQKTKNKCKKTSCYLDFPSFIYIANVFSTYNIFEIKIN